MAWASALPVGIAANRAFRQQAACHCVDFVRVQFLHALLLGNVIRFTFFEQKHRKAIVKKSIDLLWQVPLQERPSSRRCSRSLWFPGDKNKSHAGECRSGSGWGHSLKQQGAALLVLIYQLVSPPTELSGMFPPDTSSISFVFNSCMLFTSMLEIDPGNPNLGSYCRRCCW